MPPKNTSTGQSRELGSMATDEGGMPQIPEEDIEEQFVRGSGSGGQKINKTASCVVRALVLIFRDSIITKHLGKRGDEDC